MKYDNRQQKLYSLPKDTLIIEVLRLDRKVEALKKENRDLLQLLVEQERNEKNEQA